jgi:flagellar biosynthesis protein FlhF
MQIKRFEAKDMTTALRRVKEELGSDAVILSARSLRKGRGFFGSLKYAGVEVSAAVDNQLPAETYAPRTLGQNPYRRARTERMRDAGAARGRSHQTRSDSPAINTHSRSKIGSGKKPSSRSSTKAMSSLYQQILEQEVDRGIASELIEEIKRIPASKDLLSHSDIRPHVASILEDMGVRAARDPFEAGRQTILALVGTAGVGKTTTIAKLAARQARANPGRVGLITIDNYSITAVGQLESYARIIGVSLQTATNAADLKKALKRFQNKEIILIDTPGINPNNSEQIKELKACLTGISKLKIQLILSATTKEKDCIAISKAYQAVGIDQLVVTKTDESSVFGNILNVLIQTNLPLSFLCGGRRVPDDIEAGTVEGLVDLLFSSHSRHGGYLTDTAKPGKEKRLAEEIMRTARPHLVANRNSDVYHVPDCEWARRIKPANSIQFQNAREAETQNYLPCRSCNPDRESKRPASELKTAMMRHYGYR